ncbi:MAG: hypothetical protein ACFFBP_12375 [Promethearchaeota archaeon]
MIDKAQDEIKKMNQKLLFQKAELKKKYKTDLISDIRETQKSFEEYCEQFFNDSLNSTLIELNNKFLNIKREIVEELNNEIIKLTKEKIKSDYSKYINYLIEKIKEVIKLINVNFPASIIFNSRDYEYFHNENNFKKIQDLFKSSLKIKKSPNDFIGGFIMEISKLNLSYNSTIENILNKNSSLFEIELSKIISDEKIEKIKNSLTEFINNQKIEINIIKSQLNNYE